jgi:two-component system NarL family sensor kinase
VPAPRSHGSTWRPDRSLAISALLAFLALGVGLWVVLSIRLTRDGRQAAQDHAVFLADSVLRPRLPDTLLADPTPLRGDRYRDLLTTAKGDLLEGGVAAVRIFAPDGTVVFSTRPAEMGRRLAPVTATLRGALGEPAHAGTDVAQGREGNLTGEALPLKAVRAYAPIYRSDDHAGHPELAMETVTDFKAIQGPIDRLGLVVAMGLAGGFLLYLLLLVPVSRRLSRRTEEQHAQLERLLSRERQIQYQRRLLLDRSLRSGEEERTRIAAEIHDGPVQRLARLGYGLERVRSRQSQGDLKGADKLLEDMQTAVFDEVRELRVMMSRLRPPVLDQRGLEEALRDRAQAVTEETGLDCRVEADLNGRLVPALETVLFRVSQEALQNVVKHADARHARISLARNNGSVIMEIGDDGKGFDPKRTPATSDHFGLMGMRERVEMIGGTCEVVSSPGSGTRVRVVLPWQGTAA